MLQGHLDTATSSGYLEGWAFDPENLLRAVPISVCVDGEEIACGFANRYRWDLVDAGCGIGWCAFRLKMARGDVSLTEKQIFLLEQESGFVLHNVTGITLTPDREECPTCLDHVIGSDPTMVYSIDALRGCGAVFSSFLEACGAEAFVRAAYIYVLGRIADAKAISSYGNELREAALSPYELLKILYESEEFQHGPRLIAAPTDPGFAFQLP